jgi:hypothetical protein
MGAEDGDHEAMLAALSGTQLAQLDRGGCVVVLA